jgi:hypothetical protein
MYIIVLFVSCSAAMSREDIVKFKNLLRLIVCSNIVFTGLRFISIVWIAFVLLSIASDRL